MEATHRYVQHASPFGVRMVKLVAGQSPHFSTCLACTTLIQHTPACAGRDTAQLNPQAAVRPAWDDDVASIARSGFAEVLEDDWPSYEMHFDSLEHFFKVAHWH